MRGQESGEKRCGLVSQGLRYLHHKLQEKGGQGVIRISHRQPMGEQRAKSLGGWGRRQSPEVSDVVSEGSRWWAGLSGLSKVPYQVSKPCLLLILFYLERDSVLPPHPGQPNRARALRIEHCCLSYWRWPVPLLPISFLFSLLWSCIFFSSSSF